MLFGGKRRRTTRRRSATISVYPAIRPALFAIDPERAHRLALEALKAWGRLPRRSLPGDPVEILGLTFPNRLGLAAGFDKNAEAVDGIGRLGFGFIEVGTVTPRPQRGQPPPRLQRLPAARALINRLGFPNDGAKTIAARLRRRRYRGIVGVNIGKNAATPISQAAHDYVSCLEAVHDACDYVAVNISSPNTPALRELHARARLEPLLRMLLARRDELRQGHALPVLLKLSPDLDERALEEVAATVRDVGLDGVIATNTTAYLPGPPAYAALRGGLSGAPLRERSLHVVAKLRVLLGPSLPIIGVGGVDSPAAARAMRAAGADLVQVYTGLVYRGPSLVADCVATLRTERPPEP
jgi:dihydroorotate dehydrogenase